MDDFIEEDYDDYDDEINTDSENNDDTSEDESEDDKESNCLESLEDYSDNEDINLEEEKKPIKKKYFGYPFLNSFEKARVLGKRTEQIIAGSKIFVQTNKTNPYEIALEELLQKKMPLIIRRYFGNKFKDISVNDLIILD